MTGHVHIGDCAVSISQVSRLHCAQTVRYLAAARDGALSLMCAAVCTTAYAPPPTWTVYLPVQLLFPFVSPPSIDEATKLLTTNAALWSPGKVDAQM